VDELDLAIDVTQVGRLRTGGGSRGSGRVCAGAWRAGHPVGGILQNNAIRSGCGGRFFVKLPHLSPQPLDQDLAALIGVSIVSTGGLVST
jgi:hypothetical protein